MFIWGQSWTWTMKFMSHCRWYDSPHSAGPLAVLKWTLLDNNCGKIQLVTNVQGSSLGISWKIMSSTIKTFINIIKVPKLGCTPSCPLHKQWQNYESAIHAHMITRYMWYTFQSVVTLKATKLWNSLSVLNWLMSSNSGRLSEIYCLHSSICTYTLI